MPVSRLDDTAHVEDETCSGALPSKLLHNTQVIV
jgi:hypothetical protein